MTARLPTECTRNIDGRRCGRPGAARYTCRTDDGAVKIVRCMEHDPETLARFVAKVGGLIDRQPLINGEPHPLAPPAPPAPAPPVRVFCQKWEETERGWARPDGYSLHASPEQAAAFVAAYWVTMPSEPPEEYERPSGTPYWCEVPAETAARMAATPHGLRVQKHEDPGYPGDGGPDGWKTRAIVPAAPITVGCSKCGNAAVPAGPKDPPHVCPKPKRRRKKR